MSIDQAAVTNALLQQWDAIERVLTPLDEEQWLTPSVLPGWTVHDVVSHVIGTESMMLGEEPPVTHVEPHAAHVHNEIGAFNERWVEGLRDRTGAQMLEVVPGYDHATTRCAGRDDTRAVGRRIVDAGR